MSAEAGLGFALGVVSLLALLWQIASGVTALRSAAAEVEKFTNEITHIRGQISTFATAYVEQGTRIAVLERGYRQLGEDVEDHRRLLRNENIDRRGA